MTAGDRTTPLRRRRAAVSAMPSATMPAVIAAVGLLAALGPAAAARAQAPTSAPAATRPAGHIERQTFVSKTDGATVDYALFVPARYDAAKAWPLLVFLHGSQEGGSWSAPTDPLASIPVRTSLGHLPFLVAFPLMRGSVTISGPAERDVLETIDDVQAHWRVDPDRVHLTGISLGAFAAWSIACHTPDRFASLVVFCGGGQPELAVNLRHVPVRAYHGTADANVSILHTEDMINAMRAARLTPEYMPITGVGHICWRGPYENWTLYEWIMAQRRVAAPSRISYRTRSLRFAGAYWATIVATVDPSQPAFFDVFAPDGRQVLIHAENVARLRLDPPASLRRGGEPVFVSEGKPIRAARADDGWTIDLHPPPSAPPGTRPEALRLKRPGVSGPIQDVYHDAYAIVLPTGGDAATTAAWARAADDAMAWMQQLVFHNVRRLRDTEVTPQIAATHHLVCFGDATCHRVLAAAGDALPLVWRDGRLAVEGRPVDGIAATVMIYPNPHAPDRYLVVCSGEPTAAGRLAALALRPPYLSPAPIEDLLVLTKSGELLVPPEAASQPARAGRLNSRIAPRGFVFDTAWRLTPSARAALSGAARSPAGSPAPRR